MPVRAKPAPVTFLSPRGAAIWSHSVNGVARCVPPPVVPTQQVERRRQAVLGRYRIQQPVEPVLLNHTFVPVVLALDAILRDIARLGIESDNRVLAFGRIVDRPIGREFYVLPYCKFVVRHIFPLERVSSLPVAIASITRANQAASSLRQRGDGRRRQSAA